MPATTLTTQHYTPHASLAALGIKIKSLKLFDTIAEEARIVRESVIGISVMRLFRRDQRLIPYTVYLVRQHEREGPPAPSQRRRPFA